MTVSAPETESKPAVQKAIRCVDCDVHQSGPDREAMLKHVPKAWKDRFQSVGHVGHLGLHNPVGVTRQDCKDRNGKHGGSSPIGLNDCLMEPYGIDRVILTGGIYSQGGIHPDADWADIVCRVYNDALLETWIPQDDRMHMAIAVTTRDAELGAAEIRRLGAHPKVAAAIISSACSAPLGQRQFHPLYAACSELELPLMMHPGAEGCGVSTAPTAAGFPTRYIEWHTGLIQGFQAHLTSMVCEGVFQKFPKLKVVLVEGGISWIVPLMWRLDKNWKALRSTVPWLDRKPSEVIRDHVFLTTQPIEEPDNHEHLVQLFNMFDAKKMLLFASDFPHWDGDTPQFALRGFDADFKHHVMAQNAIDLFGLE